MWNWHLSFATMIENAIRFSKIHIKLVACWIFSAQCNCICTISATVAKSTNKIEKQIFLKSSNDICHADDNVLDISDCPAIMPFIKPDNTCPMFLFTQLNVRLILRYTTHFLKKWTQLTIMIRYIKLSKIAINRQLSKYYNLHL